MKQLTALLIITLVALFGCNTVKGVGQDGQATGATVENTAKDAGAKK